MSKDFRYDLDQLTRCTPDGHGAGMTWDGDPFGDFKLTTGEGRAIYKFDQGRLLVSKTQAVMTVLTLVMSESRAKMANCWAMTQPYWPIEGWRAKFLTAEGLREAESTRGGVALADLWRKRHTSDAAAQTRSDRLLTVPIYTILGRCNPIMPVIHRARKF